MQRSVCCSGLSRQFCRVNMPYAGRNSKGKLTSRWKVNRIKNLQAQGRKSVSQVEEPEAESKTDTDSDSDSHCHRHRDRLRDIIIDEDNDKDVVVVLELDMFEDTDRPTSSSSSTRKLAGARIIDISHTIQQLKDGCCVCKKELNLTNISSERRAGIASVFCVECSSCGAYNNMATSKRRDIRCEIQQAVVI